MIVISTKLFDSLLEFLFNKDAYREHSVARRSTHFFNVYLFIFGRGRKNILWQDRTSLLFGDLIKTLELIMAYLLVFLRELSVITIF